MSESGPWQLVIDEAERAAAAGDYASAERHLRDAVVLQEAALGPLHSDLANTLNNLAIVCEITGRPEDAEYCYRRAYRIAVNSLPEGHPFVATSLKNLTDFCGARNLPVDLPEREAHAAEAEVPRHPPLGLGELRFPPAPPGTPVVVPETIPRAPAPEPATAWVPPPAQTDVPVPTPSDTVAPLSERGRGASLLWVAALALLAIVLWALWPRAQGEATPAAATPPAMPSAAPAAAPPVAAPPATTTTPDVPAADSAPAARPPAPDGLTTSGRSSSPTSDAAAGVVIAAVQLCRELATKGGWVCKPPESPAEPGPMYLFARVKSSTNTVLQVRWYRDDQLRQQGELRISANQGAGYRTYSRHTIAGAGSGGWRVELRSPDGELLHEERFTVR